MTVKSQKAQLELNRYNQFIQNYELAAKIIADPVSMQRKINNGTKHIMEEIEKLSDNIDNLDDGLQLQSTSN
jgi:RNase H-fold protein (predicted Holliday junction resolvase)